MTTKSDTRENEASEALDDLYEYDIGDEAFGPLDFSIPNPKSPPPQAKNAPSKRDELGLDDEVKVRKQRITVKLDETRLLAHNGIPKLRKEAPKLKFKGKGYEYHDAGRLLSYYQLWADDLFKKARFRDTLQIIERLGHSRSMKEHRKTWIYEDVDGTQPSGNIEHNDIESSNPTRPATVGGNALGAVDNDQDLYTLPTPNIAQRAASNPNDLNPLFKGGDFDDSDDDMIDDDAIEALLAAQKSEQEKNSAISGREQNIVDEFEDEMEAMGDVFMD